MKLKTTKKYFWVFIVLVIAIFLITGTGILFFISRQNNKLPIPKSGISGALSEKAVEIKKEITKTNKTSGDLIVENNPDFNITYLISNDQFMVTIKNSSYDETKNAVEKWFLNQGFTQQELCLLRLSFSASKQIKPDFSGDDAVPKGCPVPKPKTLTP